VIQVAAVSQVSIFGVSADLTPLVVMSVGLLVMMLQGAVIAYLRIPAIVVTLGMLSILKGGLISVTGGRWITDLPQSFHLADIELFGILPMPVLIMVAATILAALWMRYSASGRAIYATGGNAEAARLCGVSPRRTVVMVFALHGLFAGIAALLFATQLKVIQSTVPPNLELTVITAAVAQQPHPGQYTVSGTGVKGRGIVIRAHSATNKLAPTTKATCRATSTLRPCEAPNA